MDIPTMLMQYQDIWFDCNAQSFSAVNLYTFFVDWNPYVTITWKYDFLLGYYTKWVCYGCCFQLFIFRLTVS